VAGICTYDYVYILSVLKTNGCFNIIEAAIFV